MKILVSGSSGMVGQALLPALEHQTHHITQLVRSGEGPNRVVWHPDREELDIQQLEGFDAVIHLAGESISNGRWTPEKKAKIRDSRIMGTELLSWSLAQLDSPPKVLISASAMGYYGDRDDEFLTEDSPPGMGFLSEVCQGWEAATTSARARGIRVANLRSGLIMSPNGGALKQILPAFLAGVGGKLGSGQQFMSWITLDDEVRAILQILYFEELEGPINMGTPYPVRNREFTHALGQVLHRPTVLPVTAFGIRMLIGEMGDALLLSSTRMLPTKLKASDFTFHYPEIEGALQHLLEHHPPPVSGWTHRPA